MILEDARVLDHPVLDLRWSLANSWNEPMLLLRGNEGALQELDEQADSLNFSFRAPWPRFKRGSTAVEWKLTEHWGGWSDKPIELWHGLIGAFNYQRDTHPRNRVRLRFRDDGGAAFDLASATLAPGDIAIRNQLNLLDGPLALAARVDLKLPVGVLSRAGGSGGFDAGVGLCATVPLSFGALHALLAFSRFSHLAASTLLQPKEWHLTAEASLEARVGPVTLLFEDRVVSPLLEPGWERVARGGDDSLLSSGLYAGFRSHNQVSLGARYGRFSTWMSEDFTPGSNPHSVLHWLWVSNAPDIVIGLAFTQPL